MNNPISFDSIHNYTEFENYALEIFKYQANHNQIYKKYIKLLNRDILKIKQIKDIPFLPIEFFKSHQVVSQTEPYDICFTSSGTTGNITSRHFIKDIALYEKSFIKAFTYFYGDISDYCILALLPAYLEREGSSLVYMADKLIKISNHKKSGFYLYDYEKLIKTISELEKQNQKTLLIGVTFALLDIAEKYHLQLKNTIIMETGGMKGRRKEIIRNELHTFLSERFGVRAIHSEYGMTELLSQAYSKGLGIFQTPPWMKILIRDTYDPFNYLPTGRTGGINVIDLANVHSCSFIETKDLGKKMSDDRFEVLGRFDNSDIRGCNLLVT